MAATKQTAFVDVRAAIRQGERLVTSLAPDLRQLQRDVRRRADAAVKDLEARRAQVVGLFEREIARAAEAVLRRLSAATQSEIAALSRRVASLEQRRAGGEHPTPRASRRKRAAEGV